MKAASRMILVAALASGAMHAAPVAATPQNVRGIGGGDTLDRHSAGDALHEGLRPLEALEIFERILELDPDDYDALWRSAREHVSLGMLSPSEGARRQRYRSAEQLARRAVEVRPEGTQGRVWLSIALGRRALGEGLRSQVRLALEARAEALAALELDPTAAGAHHVLGQWNAEVMRLGGLSRFVARRILGGGDLEEASWDAAEEHLLDAVRLAPEVLIHQLELGRVYMDTKRPDEARERFREVLERPALEPTDPLHKQRAQELLRELV